MTNNDGQPGRRRLLFGPGTLAGLAGALVVLVVGYLADKRSPPADEGTPPGSPPGLTMTAGAQDWRPEPALIVHRAGDLGLTDDQRRRLSGLNATWLERKAALRARPDGPDPDADRLAEAARDAVWKSALLILTAEQRRSVLVQRPPEPRPQVERPTQATSDR